MLALILATAMTVKTADVVSHYDRVESKQMVPMLSEAIRFETYEGNEKAHANQHTWLIIQAHGLGFTSRGAGKILEIELPATVKDAPVLGLVVHGDVQPVDAKAWSFPPFSGKSDANFVYGRGAADDKGPLVQALLAMRALAESKAPRTHTIRLLVGSEEESSASEMSEYLKDHQAPPLSLVLDSEFPVVVGEKAWDGLEVTTPMAERGQATLPYRVESLAAGLSPSIVPDRAELVLAWRAGDPAWSSLITELKAFRMPEGTSVDVTPEEKLLRIVTHGHSAHSGMNLEAGRNALLALAKLMEGRLPESGANDLLAFARKAGSDLHGASLGITDRDPVWGQYSVNVATIKPADGTPGSLTLMTNLRRIPPRTAVEEKAHLDKQVAAFNASTGAALVTGGYFEDEPLVFRMDSKIVKKLLDVYAKATGVRAKPSISGGGTYAKRLPNSIAFGMWFPGQPYPGHDVDEKIAIADLHRGTRVLIHALMEIATKPPMKAPFEP
jgi:succinyl-diaminopimelate desuccinylase